MTDDECIATAMLMGVVFHDEDPNQYVDGARDGDVVLNPSGHIHDAEQIVYNRTGRYSAAKAVMARAYCECLGLNPGEN